MAPKVTPRTMTAQNRIRHLRRGPIMPEVVRFPDIPLYQGWGAPHRAESDIRDLEVVQGEIPAELSGTLYRCGPDRQYPPRSATGRVHRRRGHGAHVPLRPTAMSTTATAGCATSASCCRRRRAARSSAAIATATPTIRRSPARAWAPPTPTSMWHGRQAAGPQGGLAARWRSIPTRSATVGECRFRRRPEAR